MKGKSRIRPSVPFGIDRLLSDGKGQPLFRLRLRRDGSQQKWSPDGLTLLHTYPPNAGGERRHHIMQADEFERFIPGDPAIVAIIQRIYREYFVESKSVYAVALGLNDDGIRSPRGKEWAMGSVRKILENSVYLDRATSDRTWVGEFYKNGAKYPLPVVRDEDSQLTQFRPEEEWYHESHPEMGSFLSFDEATKLRIHDWQLERHRRSMLKIGRKRGGNRHKDSRFILTGIIREKYSKTPLSGFCNGKSRYYILSRGMNVPKTANVERRCFNADVVEPAVKPIIQGVLASYDGIRSAVEAAVAANVKAKNEGNSILPALIVERDRILAQLDFWVNQLGDLDESVVTSKIAPLKDTVTDLGIRIESLRRQGLSSEWQQRHDGPSLESVVKSVASSWDNLPNEAIRRILRLLCVIDVDFETGEVEVEVRLPSWLAQSPALLSLCLENNTVDGSIFEAHPQWAISLGKYRFLYKGVYGGIIRLPDDVDRAAA